MRVGLRRRLLGRVQIDFRHVDGVVCGKAVRLGDGGRQLPEDPDARPIGHDRGGPPRHEPPFAMRLGADVEAQGLGDVLHHTLHVGEVDVACAAAPVVAACRAGPGAGHRAALAASAGEARANLEQPHVPLLPPPIVRDRINQARQRGRPKHRKILRQRICDRDEVALGRERRSRGFGDEAERHRLGETRSGHDGPQVTRAADPRVDRRRRGRQRREGDGQPIEPVVTRDLLDEVHLTSRVDTSRRHVDLPAIRGIPKSEPETLEDAPHIGVRNRRAEQACDLRAPQMQRRRLDARRVAIDDGPAGVPRASHLEQRARAFHRGHGQPRVGAALEAHAGFGLQAQLPAGAPH